MGDDLFKREFMHLNCCSLIIFNETVYNCFKKPPAGVPRVTENVSLCDKKHSVSLFFGVIMAGCTFKFTRGTYLNIRIYLIL